MYTQKTYANCSAFGGEWQSWSTQLTIPLKAAEQTPALRTGLTQCVNVQMIQTGWNEARGAGRSQQDKNKRRKTYREHQENPPAHEKHHAGTHLRQEKMHKIALMNHLALQEWRAHFYSQTERISTLLLGFCDTKSDCTVPVSETSISLQTFIPWERSPPCVLIRFRHLSSAADRKSQAFLLVRNSLNLTALFHFTCCA